MGATISIGRTLKGLKIGKEATVVGGVLRDAAAEFGEPEQQYALVLADIHNCALCYDQHADEYKFTKEKEHEHGEVA